MYKRHLKKRGIPIALASNTNVIHWHAMSRILHTSKDSFPYPAALSFEVGAYKPDEKILDCAWRHIGNLPKFNCLFVDDGLAYVNAAKEWGFQGLHFDGQNSLDALLAPYIF